MDQQVVAAIQSDQFETQSAEEILRWALKTFHPRIAMAWSGAEDVAVVDMMLKINPQARIFTLDTGRLNQETYELIAEVQKKYGITLEIMFPERAATEQMVRTKGMNLFYESIENRKLCCGIRKVEPLNRMLGELDAWVTGLRRGQAVTRTKLQKVEIDEAHKGIVKINPIADWTLDQVWDYIKQHKMPHNKLHDQGFPSIGCEPCTRAVKPGEDERAGRWWWELPEQKECGLHVKH